MSSDWLFVLVFYPSLILLLVAIKTWKWLGFAEEDFQRIYQMGKRHGKEELAFKIYKDAFVGEEDEEDDK